MADSRFDSALKAPIFKQKQRNQRNHPGDTDERFSLRTDGVERKGSVTDKYGRKVKENRKLQDNEKSDLHKEQQSWNPKKSGGKYSSEEGRLDYLRKLSRGEIDPGSSSDENCDSESESEGSHSNRGSSSDEEGKDEEDDATAEAALDIDTNFPVQYSYGDSATKRLAIQNCDWQNVRSIDIMMILRSFFQNSAIGESSSSSDAIECVTVFVSDFGRAMMEKEAAHGPDRSIFTMQSGGAGSEGTEYPDGGCDASSDAGDSEVGMSDDERTRDEASEKGDDDEHVEEEDEEKSEEEFGSDSDAAEEREQTGDTVQSKSAKLNEREGFDEVALKRYELSKLRYYFAIVDCASAVVANTLYSALDQVQLFEGSAMVCEMSFVPDEFDLAGRAVRDRCTSADAVKCVASYKPPADFQQMDGAQHTKVQCTWDIDEGQTRREKLLTNVSQWRDLNQSELQQYIASSDSSDASDDSQSIDDKSLDDAAASGSDSDGDDRLARRNSSRAHSKSERLRRALLGTSDGESEDMNEKDSFFLEDSGGAEDSADAADVGVVTYTYIPELDRQKIQERRSARDRVAQETPLEAELRKEAVRRAEKRKSKRKTKQQQEADSDDAQPHLERDECSDDSEEQASASNGTAARQVLQKKRGKKGKKKTVDQGSTIVDQHGAAASAELDLSDSRFSVVFTGSDPKFGIDTTSSEYRDTEAMRKILSKQSQSRNTTSTTISGGSSVEQNRKRKIGEHKGESEVRNDQNQSSVISLANKLREKYEKYHRD